MSTFTIGEVLNRLTEDFEDVTISKIRFLEAEGLIHPDRTDSGYRKFTEGDVERLRYILRAQRDRYLPLRVIREELERIDAGLPVDDRRPLPEPEEVAHLRSASADAPPVPAPQPPPPASVSAPMASDVQMDLAELARASGLSAEDARALVEHGLLVNAERYDAADLEIATLAGGLMAQGLEPRHLRMYRQFADRETSLYQQLVTPLLRQRNPESRHRASELADGLVESGGRLHRALLVKELRSMLRG